MFLKWLKIFCNFCQNVWKYGLMNTVTASLNRTVRQMTEMFQWLADCSHSVSIVQRTCCIGIRQKLSFCAQNIWRSITIHKLYWSILLFLVNTAFFSLRHFDQFFCWDILVICLAIVLKLTKAVFISLYFQTFWPDTFRTGWFRRFSQKNSFRLPYQRPSSSADCARELFNSSNGSASLVDCTQ